MKNKRTLFSWATLILIVLSGSFAGCEKDEIKPTFNDAITYGSVKDVDGNSYKTVTIGDQIWMAENLRTTKYNDGTKIPLVTVDTLWGALSTAGYCWYNNSASENKAAYGALYNWYAVNNDSLNIAPEGWHIPTDAEWTALTTYLEGVDSAGGPLKSVEGWNIPNIGADNSTGFTAMAGGFRDNLTGVFHNMERYGFFWTTTQSNAANAWYRGLGYDYIYVNRWAYDKGDGMSVRCIKNMDI